MASTGLHPEFESASHLYSHLENSPLALVEWDSDFRVRRWSKRAEQIFGWSAEEVLGLRPGDWRFVYDLDLARVEGVVAKFVTGEFQSRTEKNRNYTKSGGVIDCVWYNSVELSPEGVLKSVVSLVLDETDAKRTERELIRQTHRLESALEASRMGCWELDLVSGQVSWIGEMKTISGYEIGTFEASSASAFERIHPEDRARVKANLENALALRQTYEDEYRLLLPNDETRWLHVCGRLVFDEDGQARTLSGTAVDVTERKRDELSLRTAKDSAETSNALKSAFLANMSHEIRTPLGVILGFSELLADPQLSPEERLDYMSVVARNGQHLSRLIDDILDLSKVEANKLEIHPTSIPLRQVFEDLVANLETVTHVKTPAKHVACVVRYIGEMPDQIFTDVTRFKQIVMNLIGNAIKFTEHGEVRVDVIYQPELEPEQTPALQIRVEDSGVGISDEGRKNLFEPFVQADRSLTRRFGGTGLGLALSRKIARSMGGDITLVSSTPGAGSVFEFTLPGSCLRHTNRDANRDENLRPRSPSGARFTASGALTLAGLRVLLAEDAVDNQLLFDRMLTKRGAHLTVASNGAEAVELALKNEFDLVLMDIQMPILDGYQATRKLRALAFGAPIVALTAHAMKDEREKCLAAGCDDHLSKPVNPRDLVETILRHTTPRHNVQISREPQLAPHSL